MCLPLLMYLFLLLHQRYTNSLHHCKCFSRYISCTPCPLQRVTISSCTSAAHYVPLHHCVVFSQQTWTTTLTIAAGLRWLTFYCVEAASRMNRLSASGVRYTNNTGRDWPCSLHEPTPQHTHFPWHVTVTRSKTISALTL